MSAHVCICVCVCVSVRAFTAMLKSTKWVHCLFTNYMYTGNVTAAGELHHTIHMYVHVEILSWSHDAGF